MINTIKYRIASGQLRFILRIIIIALLYDNLKQYAGYYYATDSSYAFLLKHYSSQWQTTPIAIVSGLYALYLCALWYALTTACVESVYVYA